ncbi:AP-2 complex subunit sigma [Coemansia sp. RSA 1933]|nr:AP-2 complex subunit sigma [Coemansia sp. RSA 1933]
MSTLKFGPEWMRNASSQSKPPGVGGSFDGEQPPNGNTWDAGPGADPNSGGNNSSLAYVAPSTAVPNSFRYSHVTMLGLFKQSDRADGFTVNEIVFSDECLMPVCLSDYSEKEHEVLAGPINSGSAKRFNSASNTANAGHYQSGRQQSSLNYHHHPRNSSSGRGSTNGTYANPRARARDSIVRSSGSRSHGVASDSVTGEELAFGGSSHLVGAHDSDGHDSSLWAHQPIARSNVGTFGTDGFFRLGGDDGDDGGEPLESHPLECHPLEGGGDTPSSRNSGLRSDLAGAANGGWAWNKAVDEPSASAAGLQLQQQQSSLLQERHLVERAEQLQWWYRDPQGEIQGPFSTSHMQEWHALGYFPTDLQVCHDGGAGFQLLSSMIASLGNAQSPFLITALAYASSTRSPASEINSPATPAALSRATSSLRAQLAEGESVPSRTSVHVGVPAAPSSTFASEPIPEPQAISAPVSVVESPGVNVPTPQDANTSPDSQAMQLSHLLGEQYILVSSIADKQAFVMRLQEQNQKGLAKLMQGVTQETKAIYYRAQIDCTPVQVEALYELQQRAQAAEEMLLYEYTQSAQANAQEIALLEAKVDPVIKGIMIRDGPANALSFIEQRLQDLSVQIASEGTQQVSGSSRDDGDAGAQRVAPDASGVEGIGAQATAGTTELAADADVHSVQKKLEQISVSGSKKDSTRDSSKPESTANEEKAVSKDRSKRKDVSASNGRSTTKGPAHGETTDTAGTPSSNGLAASASTNDKDKKKDKSKAAPSMPAASTSEPSAPWSTSASTTTKKPKKTLLQIQQEEEEAMKKRQQADEKKHAQALAANPLLASAGMGSSYAGRLGSSTSSGIGSGGLAAAGGASSRYSLAAIMEEQSKEAPKASASTAGGASASNALAASTNFASRIAGTSPSPSPQGPPVFSWAPAGAPSSGAASTSVVSTKSITAAVPKQQQKQGAVKPWGGVQKQQDGSSASKLPSMEFLEWCHSRLTSLRGIDVCKFIEMLLTFPPQVPESTLEIISEQIYAYSQSLNGHAFADDFAKRRRKDYANVRGGSAKSAPENWAQLLKSKPASAGRHSGGAGSSGYAGAASAQQAPSARTSSGLDNSFQTIKRKSRNVERRPESAIYTAAAAAEAAMIRFILVQNRQGKTRLEKWYGNYSEQERNKLKAEVHRTVASRDQKHQSNFVEFHNHRIIYRRYAGLFFCFCVDTNDNELACLEAIHLFVEILDSFHGNVCELDLVFNFYMVYAVLDEIILAGEIQETSRSVILNRLDHLSNLE